MQLPKKDEAFLEERTLKWELVNDPGGSGALIIHDFDVSGGGFAPARTDLMIRIPAQYPMTPLDMWYCDPPLRLAATGQFAPATEVLEHFAGRTWQRFSRHLPGSWRPSVDGLRSFFTLIQKELQGSGRGGTSTK
jgi:hypothetical protein